MLESFPEVLKPRDLVKIGLFNSVDSVYRARRLGRAPAAICIGSRILFPKYSVISFIKKALANNEIPSINIADLTPPGQSSLIVEPAHDDTVKSIEEDIASITNDPTC